MRVGNSETLWSRSSACSCLFIIQRVRSREDRLDKYSARCLLCTMLKGAAVLESIFTCWAETDLW